MHSMLASFTDGCPKAIAERNKNTRSCLENLLVMEPREIYAQFRAKYHELVDWNRNIHQNVLTAGQSEKGYGVDHDLTVMMYCLLIAEDEHIGEMAACAALTHSWDRHYVVQITKVLNESYRGLLTDKFSGEEVSQIFTAIKLHSKPNDPNDGPVTVVLKDADRLANLGYLNIPRGAQHHCNVPVVILEYIDRMHPNSTFRKPTCWLDALRFNLEWEGMLRLPKAKKLGKPKFDFIRWFLEQIVEDFRAIGL